MPHLARRGENRETLAGLARHPLKGGAKERGIVKKKTTTEHVPRSPKKQVGVAAKADLPHGDNSVKRRQHIERLMSGNQNPAYARAVIEAFLIRHNSASEQHHETMVWLAYALRKVLDGEDANAAFGLKRDSKRPLDIQAYTRDYLIAAAAHLLSRVTGWSVKKINLTLSEKFNVTVKTVERAIKTHPEVGRRNSVLPTQVLIDIIRGMGGTSILKHIEAVVRAIGDKPTIRYFKTSTDKKSGT